MEQLLERIRNRLEGGSYANEAAVSIGIVMPILNGLGWDASDPDQVAPEYNSGRGRVDFALCLPPRRAAVFIEVKGVGRSLEGDRQLFEYAFHEGVPLCVLTDGREWSFYLPSGQGNYEERRVYRLQLDERPASECARIFARYLSHDRIRSGAALEDASKDYRDAAARREAARAIPKAWAELVSEPEELLIDLVTDRAEALCGFRPSATDVLSFLRNAAPPSMPPPSAIRREARLAPEQTSQAGSRRQAAATPTAATPEAFAGMRQRRQEVRYRVLGMDRSAASGNAALVDILRTLAERSPDRIPMLAEAVRGRSRNHIARSAAEIYPQRPDLARAVEFAPGWLVGLNIANREKISILQAACDIFGLRFGVDVVITLPNAG